MLELFGGFHGMLNQPSALLREAIRAYAEGALPPEITLREDDRVRSRHKGPLVLTSGRARAW